MSNPASPSVPSRRMAGPVLGLIVFLCVTLIGFSGYLKFQLDRAEMALAAPEAALAADQDGFEKLRRVLGYSGFIGSAQNLLATNDRANVADMKAQVQMASDMIERLPERTPPEARHDLEAIVSTFAAALHKAEQSSAGSFTVADMTPLYAALPVLDARVEDVLATTRFAAEEHLKMWALALTFVAWASLIVAAACAAGIYLNQRNREGVPLRALAQSVQNMARGDMQVPIWGLERSDSFGELARAIDQARYHFSQLPDMSVMSEQGPVRVRFEGNTRSLFEAMMQLITRDSEQVREQATSLADAILRQKETITQISGRVEIALESLYKERTSGAEDIRETMHSIAGSAQSLQKAQEYAAAQLSRLTGFMQERAQGLADLTQIAGKQVAQSLQSLDRTEHHLRLSADQNQETAQRMSSTADDLNDRMASAIALLRAGGKVLNETAEATQGRLNEAVDLLHRSEIDLRQLTASASSFTNERALDAAARSLAVQTGEQQDPAAVQHLKMIVGNLEIAQRKLEECLARQSQATQAQIELLTTHSNSLLTQASTAAQTLIAATGNLRDERNKLDQITGQLSHSIEQVGDALEARVAGGFGKLAEFSAKFEPIAAQLATLGQLTNALGSVAASLGPLNPAIITAQGTATENLMTEVKAGFEVTARSIERIREEFLNFALKQAPAEAVASSPVGAQWDRIAAQIESARESLLHAVVREADRVEARYMAIDKKVPRDEAPPVDAQTQLQQQTQILSDLASALGAIDAHMQEIERSLHSA
jgi:methyl-accepting chemotaxis protein